jgi:serine/threonine protein kinase
VDRGWLLDEASHFSGVLGLNKLLLTALELAKALAYLHRLDIMHGDLTGGNVMLHSAPVTKQDPRGFTVKVQLQSDSEICAPCYWLA